MVNGLWHDASGLKSLDDALDALECFLRINNAKLKNVPIHDLIDDIAKNTILEFSSEIGINMDLTMEKLSIDEMIV